MQHAWDRGWWKVFLDKCFLELGCTTYLWWGPTALGFSFGYIQNWVTGLHFMDFLSQGYKIKYSTAPHLLWISSFCSSQHQHQWCDYRKMNNRCYISEHVSLSHHHKLKSRGLVKTRLCVSLFWWNLNPSPTQIEINENLQTMESPEKYRYLEDFMKTRKHLEKRKISENMTNPKTRKRPDISHLWYKSFI